MTEPETVDFDWDWEPWMMWDGLVVANENGDLAAIAHIGLTALAREEQPEFGEAESASYQDIWKEALGLLDNRGGM